MRKPGLAKRLKSFNRAGSSSRTRVEGQFFFKKRPQMFKFFYKALSCCCTESKNVATVTDGYPCHSKSLMRKYLQFFFSFIENRIFSHTVHPDLSLPPLLPLPLYLPSPSDPLPISFPSERSRLPRDNYQTLQNRIQLTLFFPFLNSVWDLWYGAIHILGRSSLLLFLTGTLSIPPECIFYVTLNPVKLIMKINCHSGELPHCSVVSITPLGARMLSITRW